MHNPITTWKVSIKGVAPLIQHNGNLANHFNPFVRAMKELQAASKRNKTDEFYRQMAKLEWNGGLYLNDKEQIILPSDVLQGCVIKAGKRLKKGDVVKTSIYVETDMTVEYNGPKDREQLFEDRRFVHQVMVVNPATRSRVLRTRPIFRDWGGTFQLSFDHEQVQPSQVRQLLDIAGRFAGLGDNRPVYGRFEVTEVKPV